MKQLVYIFLLGIITLLTTSCKQNLTPGIIGSAPSFDDYWENLDPALRNELADQVSRKVREEFFESEAFQSANDRGVPAEIADSLTENYYEVLQEQVGPGGSIDEIEKSIYFDAELLSQYLNIINEKCASTGQSPGLRIYFARYDMLATDPDRRGRMTVILRGTGDYKDLAHDPADSTNRNFVAWNYGDPCPPLCNKDESGNIQRCRDGRYQSGGHARVLDCN